MDEAFHPLHRVIQGLTAAGDIRDEDAGIRFYIDRYAIETPVELDLTVGPDGAVEIGSAPPLYRVDTSLRPSFHQLRFTAVLEHREDGDG